ncbi:MAG: peptidoglycan DD-metalloendopeptidase family protein [Patescibacteria group bacterium]
MESIPLYSLRILIALSIILSATGVFLTYAQISVPPSGGGATTTLRDSLQKKAEELQKIQDQKNVVQKNLDTVLQSKNSLNREINVLDSNIGQLNLSIKASRLNIEKLSDEIGSLGDQITGLHGSIVNQQATVAKLFIELQEKDHENPLTSILRNARLSEAVSEIRSISSLSSSLTENMGRLRSLQEEMNNKLDEARTKKTSKEQERITLVGQQYIVKDQKEERQRLLEQTKNRERVYQQQLSALEKVQDEISAEVEKIESVLRKSIDPNLLPIARKGLFLWPVLGARLTQGYGSTAFALRNYRGRFHNGVDLGGVPVGSPILAAESGVVINSGDQDKFCRKGAYGKFVEIKHENGLATLYGHLSRYIVNAGDRVERGQIIGFLGRTGYATGPHLHFTVFANQTLSPARAGVPEGSQPSRQCGLMPIGGHIDPTLYL